MTAGSSTGVARRHVSQPGSGRAASFGDGLRQAVALVAWIHLYLIGTLGIWVVMAMFTTGWQPVALTSGSMAPGLRPGDVILIKTDADEPVAQGSVITFVRSDDEEPVTHRVFAVLEDGRFVTKGDANPTPDTDRVAREQVVGVGRLVIPVVGLPLVWGRTGQSVPLIAFGLLTAAAVVVVSGSLFGDRRRSSPLRNSTPLVERAIRRVRALSVFIVLGQFVFERQRFDSDVLGVSQTHILLFVLTCLIGTNLAATWAAGPKGRPLPLWADLAADTVVVVLLTAITGGSGIGWVMMALPIVEAAIRFRLTGALGHWMVMGVVTVAVRLFILDRTGAGVDEFMDQLDHLLDQFGVLLLVAIPGAYLAEQLAGDVDSQAKATDRASLRSRHLEHVAEVGRQVNRMGIEGAAIGRSGAELFAVLAAAAEKLGFDACDVWIRRNGEWRRVAAEGEAPWGPLPAPDQPGSGLQSSDLEHGEVIVDADDPDPDEWRSLDTIGATRLVRITLGAIDETLVTLRVIDAGHGADRSPGDVEALRLLCAQATVALQNNKLLSDLRAVHDELEHRATHDALTGLPNRTWFMTALGRRSASGAAAATGDIVLFLDLNGFKQVNDTLGHEAGDELLIKVASRLAETIGSAGALARLGGDEFTILLQDGTDDEQARQVASRVHAALTEPFTLQAGPAKVGTSIGIAVRQERMDDTELLRRADAAMYSAKTAGGDTRTAFYERSLDEGERRRGRLVAEFLRALEEKEIDIAYQPVVGATTGTIHGVEALLRWHHRELGLIDTETTLELADEAGASNDLNRWILERATQTLMACVPSGDIYLAVNVSPEELTSAELPGNIGDALVLSGLPADRLVVELSERLVSDDRQQVGNIDALARLGVRLSLDDFGEGRTSLAHLRGLPISQLKIDRRLVQNACESEVDHTILRSVTTLAADLSMEVVAEGIENEHQRSVMVDLGIDLLQGYGLFRPLDADRLRRLLTAERSGARPAVDPPLLDPSLGGGPGEGRG